MQKLKSDIQKRILDVAESLFVRKGYKNTAMREIAAQTGVGLTFISEYIAFETAGWKELMHA